MKKTVVIGGGAAGLIAAGFAAKKGNAVTVIEKNARPARKVMITGKGRCNVTNDTDLDGLLRNVAKNPKFLYSAFSSFSSADTKELMENLGVPLKTERGNRVFPCSDKSVDIVDALIKFAVSNGAAIVNDTVSEICVSEGRVYAVKTVSGAVYSADSVILSTGGLSYPLTGSTGDGYRFAENAGHTVTDLSPSLVPITVREGWCPHVEGLSLKNVTLSLFENGKKKPVYSELGELVFTSFGISGPLALSASAHISSGKDYEILIDMKPALDISKLDARVLRDFDENKNKNFANSLSALLPKSFIPVAVRLSGIDPDTKVNSITREQRENFVNLIKNVKLTVTGLRPIDEAIITRGGVNIKEINPATMESKICKGLFFAGEIIDVDAYTGGFNLQIAFSTGALAGNNC